MSPRGLLLVTAVAACAAAASPTASDARPVTTTRTGTRLEAKLRRALRPAGTHASVVVHDSRSRRVADVRGATRRPLGSTTKLFTAAATLRTRAVLTTTVLSTAPVGADGVLSGDLVLRGGGDPSLGSAAFASSRAELPATDGAALADQLVAAGLREVHGSVVGDEGRFDALRGGPTTRGGFDPELDGVLGALTWNRGRASDAGGPLTDPARGAAAAFDDVLEARNIIVRGVPHAGLTSAGAVQLAAISRPTASLVHPMLKGSDDLYAETLAKDLGARTTRRQGTTANGAAAVMAAANALGTAPRLVDGSGLSARSVGSARDLVGLLERARRRPWGPTLQRALPIAGIDGTLRTRLTTIRGRCWAKTGSLGNRASALAGTCRTRSGHLMTFAALVETQSLASGHAIVDHVATTIVSSRR